MPITLFTSCSRTIVRPDAVEQERQASEFLEHALARRRGPSRSPLRPVRMLRGLQLLHRLPVLHAPSAGGPERGALRRGLHRGHPIRRALLGGTTSVLQLPASAEEYLLGASKQTLRRKMRVAERSGVTWRAVDGSAERERLLHQLDESERTHARAQYRHSNPQNQDLLGIDTWLIAQAADDRPLLLVVVPFDGQWAALRTFRTLEESDEASAARYLMSAVLAEHLIERGVRYLADTQSPASLPPGLRFFQRVIGYRLVRVRLRPARRTAASSSAELAVTWN